MERVIKYFPEFTESKIEQFRQIYDIYYEWNKKINVISRRDIENLYIHHVLHSLSIAKAIQFTEGCRVLDVGTGGGFPGIPLAIAFPEAEFLLCDSINKKLIVANDVIHTIGLKNVTTKHCRAEELNGNFDFVVSRAVTELSQFLSWIWNKIDNTRIEGAGILYLKGGDVAIEISETINRNRLNPNAIQIFEIDKWFYESYFFEKKIVHIKK